MLCKAFFRELPVKSLAKTGGGLMACCPWLTSVAIMIITLTLMKNAFMIFLQIQGCGRFDQKDRKNKISVPDPGFLFFKKRKIIG